VCFVVAAPMLNRSKRVDTTSGRHDAELRRKGRIGVAVQVFLEELQRVILFRGQIKLMHGGCCRR